jgi:hypothetical protein
MPSLRTVAALLLLASFAQKSDDEVVTFSEHVAPILFENCTVCHRPGASAPFDLMDYEDARKRARMLAVVTEQRLMPPWPPVEGHGDFVGARHLSPSDIETLRRWAEQGTPEGDPAVLPARPEFPDGWVLGPPDLVVTMPNSYEVPADGPDIYRHFQIPVELDEDKWVNGIEVHPGDGGVVHHLLVGFKQPGSAPRVNAEGGFAAFEGMEGTDGRLSGWAVGSSPLRFPSDVARKLPKGMDIVLHTHFHPIGKAVKEKTTIGLYFADEPPERSIVSIGLPPCIGKDAGLDIPAGEKNFTLRDTFEFPVAAEGVYISGHAHYLARELHATLTLPDGEERSIFYIDDWAFNWQGAYQYTEFLQIPKGTRLHIEIVYDNSEDNPSNPFHPPQPVSFGYQSTDEMGRITLGVLAKSRKATRTLRQALIAHEQAPENHDETHATMVARMRQFDRELDGHVKVADTPPNYAEWFARIDLNGDGVLTPRELSAFE